MQVSWVTTATRAFLLILCYFFHKGKEILFHSKVYCDIRLFLLPLVYKYKNDVLSHSLHCFSSAMSPSLINPNFPRNKVTGRCCDNEVSPKNSVYKRTRRIDGTISPFFALLLLSSPGFCERYEFNEQFNTFFCWTSNHICILWKKKGNRNLLHLIISHSKFSKLSYSHSEIWKKKLPKS